MQVAGVNLEDQPHFSLGRDSLSILMSVSSIQGSSERSNPRSNHVWRTSFVCLLVSNTPGFDNVSHMTALVVDLGIVAHRV